MADAMNVSLEWLTFNAFLPEFLHVSSLNLDTPIVVDRDIHHENMHI